MFDKKISVMILAAGYGNRLQPLTKKIPKPLITISGKTLLQNTLNFVLKLNCREIIINTHYKHEKINDFVKKNYSKENIIISYEKELLDTGGGVKNAIPLFTNNEVLIMNSDIFWISENLKDIKNFINNYKYEQICKLLLVPKKLAHGIYNNRGDFFIKNNLIYRFKKSQKIYYYSGVQIISLNIFKQFKQKNFSFNKIWNELIDKKLIYGDIMESKWFHVGDIKGLKEAENIIT